MDSDETHGCREGAEDATATTIQHAQTHARLARTGSLILGFWLLDSLLCSFFDRWGFSGGVGGRPNGGLDIIPTDYIEAGLLGQEKY